MCFCRLLDRLVSKVRKLEDVYATIKHVGARHAEGGYSVTSEHMKVNNRFSDLENKKLYLSLFPKEMLVILKPNYIQICHGLFCNY